MIRLATLIRTFETEFLAYYQASLLPSQRKALAAIKDCRTSASPHLLAHCSECDSHILMPHSCGHRSCPHCQHHQSQRWLASAQQTAPRDVLFIDLHVARRA